MSELKLDDCVNPQCPWSGCAVSEDALTIYRGYVVGFCNPGCRDGFVAEREQDTERAICARACFDEAINARVAG